MARSLNKVQLIGNLTRDPELRYTPSGTAVATFSIATNRQWKTDTGEMKDEAEFHRIVAWDKLAEICSQLLKKGSKAFVEGRIQSRKWTGKDEQERTTFEIIISEMMILDSKSSAGGQSEYSKPEQNKEVIDVPDDFGEEAKTKPTKDTSEETSDDDIPF